jgi:hypothetical protein
MKRTVMSLAGTMLGLALIVAGLELAQPPRAPARAEEIAAAIPSFAIETPIPSTAVATAVPPSPAPTSEALGRGWRIRVARVGIDMALVDGDASRDIALQQTPDGSAFRLAGSALPGTPGNTYVYGHARWAQFLGLWYARVGDVVVITGPGTTLSYRITEVHPRVGVADLTYLVPSTDERLTLQTSSGPNATDPRFVVVALRER